MDSDVSPSRLDTAGTVPTAWNGHVTADREFTPGLLESVNHHLRTPLTVVLGHAELLAERESDLPLGVGQSLACLLRAAQRLDDVVGGVCDLMDLACVDPDPVRSIDITKLVTQEVATFGERAAKRGVRLQTSGEPAQQCIADPRRLRRALRELLDNALTYAPDRSSVRVACTSSVTRLRIEVTDQGDGIDVNDRERLKRPFERGTHPRQPITGRGMGLAVASAVAVWHGGGLTLSAGPGGGLRACIELPASLGR